MTLAVLFPGQGAQHPGMGAGLWEADAEFLNAHLRRAAAASALPIDRLVADGSAAALTRTDVTQPAVCAVSLALFDVARELGLRPVAFAGHSLGEYTAAVAAGVLTPDDGASFVALRGRLMAQAQRERPGAMAAVFGPTPGDVAALCAQAAEGDTLELANFNTPQQTVVSGDAGAVARLLAQIDGRPLMQGARLQAGAAFHSSLMSGVAEELRAQAALLHWRDPSAPIASNAFAALLRSGPEVRESLLAQVTSPVRWVECVHALVAAGCAHFLELGPGRILRGLVRQLSRRLDVASADSRAALEEFLSSRPQLRAAQGVPRAPA